MHVYSFKSKHATEGTDRQHTYCHTTMSLRTDLCCWQVIKERYGKERADRLTQLMNEYILDSSGVETKEGEGLNSCMKEEVKTTECTFTSLCSSWDTVLEYCDSHVPASCLILDSVLDGSPVYEQWKDGPLILLIWVLAALKSDWPSATVFAYEVIVKSGDAITDFVSALDLVCSASKPSHLNGWIVKWEEVADQLMSSKGMEKQSWDVEKMYVGLGQGM